MANRKVTVDILARDRASRAIDNVADSAEDAGKELDKTAKAAETLDDKIEAASKQVKGFATEMSGLDQGSARFKELNKDFTAANRALSQMTRLRKSLGSAAAVQVMPEVDNSGLRSLRSKLAKIRTDIKVNLKTDDRGSTFGLLRNAGQLAGMGVEAGSILGRNLGSGVATALQASGPVIQTALTGALVVAAAAAAPVVVTALGAALASGIALVVSGGVLAGGIAAAAKDSKVKAAFKSLTGVISVKEIGAPFVKPLIESLGIFRTELARLKPQILGIFSTLAPAVVPLAKGLAGMFAQMLPGIQALMTASLPLLNTLAQKLPLIGAAFTVMFQKIAAAGPGMTQVFSDLLTVVAGAIAGLGIALGWLSAKYLAVRGAVVATVEGIKTAWSTLTGFFNASVAFIGGLPGRISAILASLPARVASLAHRTFIGMAAAVGFGIGTVIRLVATLPGRVVALAAATWSGARAAFSAGVSAVARIVAALPGRVSGALQSIPGRVRSLAGSASAAAAGVGRAIISGLVGGIRSMAGAAASAAMQAVSAAVSAARSALGINSPSRVFAEIGKQTIAGYAQGVTGNAPVAARAVGAAMPGAPAMPAFGRSAPASRGGSGGGAVRLELVGERAVVELLRMLIRTHSIIPGV